MFDQQYDTGMWGVWLAGLDLPAVAAADSIGIFAQISAGNNTVDQLAKILKLDYKGIDALTTFLASLNLLCKAENQLMLTDGSVNYLLPNSPSYWGPALVRAKALQVHQKILETLDNQKTTQFKKKNKSLSDRWQKGEINYNEAKKYTAAMHSIIFTAAACAFTKGIFDSTEALLDIGAGSACFTALFIKNHPNRRCGVFELPEVCRVTKEYLEKDIVSSTVEFYAKNFFKDPFPTRFTGILFSNILHDWPIEIVKFLLKKAFDALPDNGKIFIHEMLLNNEKCGPKIPAAFNLLMYINHNAQQFSQRELLLLLKETGFSNICIENAHPLFSMVIANK